MGWSASSGFSPAVFNCEFVCTNVFWRLQNVSMCLDKNGTCMQKWERFRQLCQKEILEYISSHLIEKSVLKVTNVKLKSLVWKIRHFKGQIRCLRHRLQSHFPSHPVFPYNWSPPQKSKPTLGNKARSYNHRFNCSLLGTLHYRVITCIQTAQKTVWQCENTSNLKASPHLFNLTRPPQMLTR